MSQWLQSFAYRIDIGWQVLIVAIILVNTVALLTISFQAIKTATANGEASSNGVRILLPGQFRNMQSKLKLCVAVVLIATNAGLFTCEGLVVISIIPVAVNRFGLTVVNIQ